MLREDRYKLVVNPDSVNELYDLHTDPDELMNVYGHPETDGVRRRMMRRLCEVLRERGDNFYHWMTTMYDVGEVDHDPTQSGLDETTDTGARPQHHRKSHVDAARTRWPGRGRSAGCSRAARTCAHPSTACDTGPQPDRPRPPTPRRRTSASGAPVELRAAAAIDGREGRCQARNRSALITSIAAAVAPWTP